jgi:hypothetical protein
MTRYALSRTTNDRWPIEFRPDRERTYFNPSTGKDESLLEVMKRLDKSGYDLLHSREDLVKELEKRNVYIGVAGD